MQFKHNVNLLLHGFRTTHISQFLPFFFCHDPKCSKNFPLNLSHYSWPKTFNQTLRRSKIMHTYTNTYRGYMKAGDAILNGEGDQNN